MARKIIEVKTDGQVLFEDIKTGRGDAGTSDDCKAYGYDYRNSKCYAYSTQLKKAKVKKLTRKGNADDGHGNNILGEGNKVVGSKNTVLGHFNDVSATFSTAIGQNIYVENSGVLGLGFCVDRQRARYAVVNFTGVTTDGNTKELTIGGLEENRFFINTDYETAYAIDYTAVALNAVSNEMWSEHGNVAYKYANSTLTEVGHGKGTLLRDSALDYSCNFSAHTHVRDHISVDVQGETGHTAYWTVTLRITEVRYG